MAEDLAKHVGARLSRHPLHREIADALQLEEPVVVLPPDADVAHLLQVLGIESVGDIIADLEQGLAKAASGVAKAAE